MDLCEFLAEDELIEIVPTFTHDKVLNLINGDFGPFKPGISTRVPIWMALNLSRQQKCRIITPHWILELDQLVQEQEQSSGLIKMPSNHWREVLQLLQTQGIVIPQCARDLIERRDAILKKSLRTLLDSVVNLDEDRISQVKIKNITKFELNSFKRLITANLSISKSIQ